MKKVKSSYVIVFILTIIVLVVLTLSFTEDENIALKRELKVINITKSNNPKNISLKYRDIRSISVSKATYSSCNLIIEDAILNNEFVKKVVLDCLSNGYKIVIKGNGINKSTIFNELKLNEVKSFDETDKALIKLKEEKQLFRKAVLLYKNGFTINCVGINVEQEDESFIYNAFVNCLSYDYSISTRVDFNELEFNRYTESDIYEGYDVHESLIYACDPTSPTSTNKYKSYAAYSTEVIPRKYRVKSVNIMLKETSGAKNLSYYPNNKKYTKSVNTNFPFANSQELDIGLNVDVSKEEGGIDSNYTKVKFTPQNMLRLNSTTSKNIRCYTGYVAYKTDGDSIFTFIGSYEVDASKK